MKYSLLFIRSPGFFLRIFLTAAPFLALSLSPAHAASQCFEGKMPVLQELPARHSSELARACQELGSKEMQESVSLAGHVFSTFTGATFGLLGHAVGAFEKLGGTARENAYRAGLEKIKKIQDPIERIRLVYRLAADNEGVYDESRLVLSGMWRGLTPWSEAPKAFLAERDGRGTVGVCREMAGLLTWSLMQVARAADSTAPQLGPNDFSADFTTGFVPGNNGWKDGGGHAWVRINRPIYRDGRLAGFSHFDLDTTWYPQDEFSPLIPRRNGMSEAERRQAYLQCYEISNCLDREGHNP